MSHGRASWQTHWTHFEVGPLASSNGKTHNVAKILLRDDGPSFFYGRAIQGPAAISLSSTEVCVRVIPADNVELICVPHCDALHWLSNLWVLAGNLHDLPNVL